MDELRQITLQASVENLREILSFVSAACREAGSGAVETHSLKLAVEEICMNVMTHGYDGQTPGPITVTFRARPSEFIVTVADRASVFRPREAPEPDTGAGWESRPIGGLGWYLVRQLVDDVRHDALPEGGNRVTLVKKRANG